jgi:hypothetical protein
MDEPDPRTENEDGVDITLIQWLLSLTPRERLESLSSAVRSLEKLRGVALKP